VQVRIRESKVFDDAQGVFVESAHGDGDTQATEKQEDLWIAHTSWLGSGSSFYQKLNELLEAEGFDEFVESRCVKFYASGTVGRPDTGIYFALC